jgi:ATP-dependent DNA ligase
MDCLPVPKVPEGPLWVYEVKLDGYRAIGVKRTQGKLHLFSRRGKSFDRKFPDVSKALATLPRGTVIDGEIVALARHYVSCFGFHAHWADRALDLRLTRWEPKTRLSNKGSPIRKFPP